MNFVEFITNYWQVLVFAILTLVEILILLLKKNKLVDNNLTLLFKALPTFIKDAENKFTDGLKKKLYVLSMSIEFLKAQGLDEKTVNSYVADIEKEIEEVLSTPQKKEGDING